jgi:hypothetical protein
VNTVGTQPWDRSFTFVRGFVSRLTQLIPRLTQLINVQINQPTSAHGMTTTATATNAAKT